MESTPMKLWKALEVAKLRQAASVFETLHIAGEMTNCLPALVDRVAQERTEEEMEGRRFQLVQSVANEALFAITNCRDVLEDRPLVGLLDAAADWLQDRDSYDALVMLFGLAVSIDTGQAIFVGRDESYCMQVAVFKDPMEVAVVCRAIASLLEQSKREVDEPRRKRMSPHSPRNQWLYEKYMSGISAPDLVQMLETEARNRGWDWISTPPGIHKAIKQHCADNDIPKPRNT